MIDCSKCPDRGICCGIIGFPKELAMETQNMAQVKPKQVIQNDGKLYILTEDMKCIYLNRQTKKCVIYEKRPEICQIYGLISACPCPYFKTDGTKRALWDKQITQIKIDQTVNRAIEMIKNSEQLKGGTNGNDTD